MARTELKKVLEQAEALAGQQITVCGWVKTIRDSKACGFIELNDGTFLPLLHQNLQNTAVERKRKVKSIQYCIHP